MSGPEDAALCRVQHAIFKEAVDGLYRSEGLAAAGRNDQQVAAIKFFLKVLEDAVDGILLEFVVALLNVKGKHVSFFAMFARQLVVSFVLCRAVCPQSNRQAAAVWSGKRSASGSFVEALLAH